MEQWRAPMKVYVKLIDFRIATAALLAVMFAITTAQAQTYRWVDERGRVYYSDQIPPQHVDKAHSVINKQGVTLDRVEKAKTAEQFAEEKRLAAMRAEVERIARQEAIYDRILLDTFAKVEDLEATRDRRIATIEGLINVSQHKIETMQKELDALTSNAASMERQGQSVPDDVRFDTLGLQAQIERERGFIRSQRTQQKDVRAKFAADIVRYNALKAELEAQEREALARP